MHDEFWRSPGLSVLSLWLIPWRNQVLLELVAEPPKKSGPRAPIDVSTDLR